MGANEKISSHVLELPQLIGAPLIAVIDADTMATRRYIDFLSEVAFEKNPDGNGTDFGHLRTFTFSYDHHDIQGTVRRDVSIPVISMISLPLMQVKDASFEFDIKIIDAVSDVKQQRFLADKDSAESPAQTPAGGQLRLRASLAPKSGRSGTESSQSLSANIKVKINMQQADVPAGLTGLLHLTGTNMKVSDQPAR